MISYCISAWRPAYCEQLIVDLVRKTTVPFEILLWLNTDDAHLRAVIDALGPRVTIVGYTPDNTMGMKGLRECFLRAKYPLVTQIDDDVVRVSPRIAETALDVMRKHVSIKQVVTDVWQDRRVDGARPPMRNYALVDPALGLYDGPLDGWFSVVDRESLLETIESIPWDKRFFFLGGEIKNRLALRGKKAVLCTKSKVFHLTMSEYMVVFEMLEFEIAKYKRVMRENGLDLRGHVSRLEALRPRAEDPAFRAQLCDHVCKIYDAIDRFGAPS